MKQTHQTRHGKGFTLIELLVVITIVAVLAAMSFAGVTAAMKKAKKTKSEAMANSLVQAIEDYYNAYSRLPDLDTGFKTNDEEGVQLLEILLAEEGDGDNLQNPKQISFLSIAEGKQKKGGLVYNGNTIEGLYDAFGQAFTIELNVDYEDALEFNYDGTQTLRGKNAAVYSEGADGEEGTADDVRTFEKQ